MRCYLLLQSVQPLGVTRTAASCAQEGHTDAFEHNYTALSQVSNLYQASTMSVDLADVAEANG